MSLEYMDFRGCGACELCNQNINCKEIHVPVNITFKKAEKADNWGKMVTVFSAGETVQGEAVIKDNKVYCASACSNIYERYDDFVGLENIKIELTKMNELDMKCGECPIIDYCNDYEDTPPCSQPRFKSIEVQRFMELAKTSKYANKNALLDDVYKKLTT